MYGKASPLDSMHNLGTLRIYLFFWSCLVASGILVPGPRVEPEPWLRKYQVLTVEPPGKSTVGLS